MPLVEDEELRKAVVAWKSVEIQYKSAAQCSHTGDVAQWNWLWEQVGFDENKFGVVAGLRAQDVGRMVSRLIGLRLVYPDGTISRYAKQYLQMQILSKIRMPQPKSKAKNEVPASEPEKDGGEKSS